MPAVKTATAPQEQVVLARLKDLSVEVEIEGLTPLIPHQWSEKAKRLMPGHPDKPTTREIKGVREPEAEAEACVYRLPDGESGMPATAFKAAMVDACRFFEKPSMKEAKMLFFVDGIGPDQLVAFEGEPTLREDTPRNANGNADLRYRYAFFPWRAKLTIRYVEARIAGSSVVALIDAAGRVGVGDWRPGSPHSNTGTFGTFRVVSEGEV